MNIHVEQIANWDDRPVKHKRQKYPQCSDKNTPRCFFVGQFIGARGSGKTFALVKLIRQFQDYKIFDTDGNEVEQRCILMSPTYTANPVFKALKHLDEDDIHANYTDEKLLEVVEEIQKDREETKRYKEDLLVWQKFLRAKDKDDLTPDDYFTLGRLGYNPPSKPAHPNGVVVHLVLDDCVGSSAFKAVGKSALVSVALRNRHIGINLYIASQNMKSVPKSLRSNTSLWCLFRFANKKIVLNDLYDEVSGFLTPEEFETVYDFAVKDDHSPLVMDLTGTDKSNRIRKGFSERIVLPGLEN